MATVAKGSNWGSDSRKSKFVMGSPPNFYKMIVCEFFHKLEYLKAY